MSALTRRTTGAIFGAITGLAALAWLARSDAVPALAAVETAGRFRTVDLFIDSKETPLGAYQLSLVGRSGEVRIVGIEGGEHPAFRKPPFYDLKAIQHERVIIAAFSTASPEDLPRGKTRVAVIHVQTLGDKAPDLAIELQVAADPTGKRIFPAATFEMREPQ
jgi:hypothetical protein